MNLFEVYPLFDIMPVKAEGSHVWDKNGTRYLDLYGGHAVISVGHSHPHYVQRITEQVQKIGFYSNSVQNPLQVELADKLGEISNYSDFDLFLCNSGAEANENALKLASFHTGRKKVVSFRKGFHGRTEGAVVITDNPSVIAPINETENVIFLPLNDSKALKEALGQEDVCAVIVEGIQGIGGIHLPTDKFLQDARQFCDETGTILILDEIQSGYGRSGKFFAHQYAGIEADLIPIAKGMGNGFPIGGVLISPKFEARMGMLGTTFGGNHLACVAGLAVLEIMKDEDLIQNAQEIGTLLMQSLAGLKGIKEIRGRGLMIGIELEEPFREIRNELLNEHQIFTGASSDGHTLRLLPALNLSRENAEFFIEKFKLVLNK